jgi:urease accessory protein
MLRNLFAALLALMPGIAFAHTGAGDAAGFFQGFSHPFGGVDHVLTMVAVGMLGAQLGGRAVWLLPLSFLAVMAAGGVLGIAAAQLPSVDIGIGLGVIVLGLAIAFRIEMPIMAASGLIALVALLHGHAHGAEMPGTVSGPTYGAGFLCATATLLALGIGVGTARVFPRASRRIAQAGGAAIALAGLALLGGAL